MSLELHPFCRLVPEASPEDYGRLRDSIKDHGQQQPAKLYQGKVLDGRTRLKACDELGVPLLTEEFSGDDRQALDYVYNANVPRRHLNASQRALLAVEFLKQREALSGAATTDKRPDVSGDTSRQKSKDAAGGRRVNKGTGRADQAKRASVGEATISRARVVSDKGTPALIAAVRAGVLTATKGAKLAELPADQQQAALAAPAVRPAPRPKTPPKPKGLAEPITPDNAEPAAEPEAGADDSASLHEPHGTPWVKDPPPVESKDTDRTGRPIPPALRPSFDDGAKFLQMAMAIRRIGRKLYQQTLREVPGEGRPQPSPHLEPDARDAKGAFKVFSDLASWLEGAAPSYICSRCDGSSPETGVECNGCGDKGWLDLHHGRQQRTHDKLDAEELAKQMMRRGTEVKVRM